MRQENRRTVRDLRRTNRSRTLRHLYFEGPLSRQELVPATGLSSASVSNVTAELLGEGLLEEAGSAESEGGRPRTLLRVAPGAGTLIGVDVGETRVRVELFNLALEEHARAEYPLRDGGHPVAHVVRLIADGLAAVRESAARSKPPALSGPMLGVGVGVPGIVDRGAAGGAVVHGQTVGWDAVPLEALLRTEAELPEEVPLLVSNGAKTLGQAEMWFGAGRGARDAVVALLGSGVGAGVITEGGAYGPGFRGAAEWGHTTLRAGGRACRCGAAGCLEAYVGAAAVLERWREAGGRPEGDQEAGLAQLLAARDAAAEAVLAETAEHLGAGIANLVNLFSPERIVLAGWAGLLLGARLLPAVREAARARALAHPAGRTAIELGRLGPDAVTVGAATLPLARFLAAGGRPVGSPGHGSPPRGSGAAHAV
ncbi:ROK family protein [Streptomyces qinglanensis]|uniref:Sugar kinase of the NBD/HSP70 family, may contain an N-terminal HTH domain n=1 Tax=Streptomyces qinglanensis TaxID=943816 RepID=A0A1H9WFX9_9ACTN|nr:ROK family protein [Streptomyces qinglanensis]SES32826.1 Sugar kinase of the NBD/HSP70 family, may contain an N-terminal HTH domain [Streptomyces qinglanensis]